MISKPIRQHNRLTLWAMVGVLLLACGFYVINLNRLSFWHDESWLAIAISGSPGAVWTFAATRGVHPPLYFYLAYGVQFLWGNSEFALRWMGGLIALIGVAFTYRLGVDTVDRKTGVFAALLVTGSIFLIYLTRMARHYTLFYTLSAALIWAYWRWRNHAAGWRWWAAIVVLQTAAFYTHYFSIFLALTIGLHGLVSILFRRRRFFPLTPKSPLPQGARGLTEFHLSSPKFRSGDKQTGDGNDDPAITLQHFLKLLGAFALSGILFLPWLPAINTQMHSDLGEGLYYGVPGVRLILDNYSGRVTNDNLWLGGGMALAGLVALLMQRKWTLISLLFIWVVVTFSPVIIVNEAVFQWYIGRNMLYTLPAVMLLYGAGLAYIARSRWGMVVALSVAAAFVLFGTYVYNAYWPGTPDWRGILHRIAQDARPDDIFVLDSDDPYTPDYYLWRYLGKHIHFYDMEAWTENPILGERIWFIDTGMDVNHEALAVVSDTMIRTRRFFWSPLVADFWQTPPENPAVIYGEQLALGYRGDERLIVKAGDALRLDVWWMAQRVPDFNYSAGFALRGANGVVIAQQDGNFDSGRVDARVLPVGLWTPDARTLHIPVDAMSGMYTLLVTVYDWRDGTRLPTSTDSLDDLYPLLTVVLE